LSASDAADDGQKIGGKKGTHRLLNIERILLQSLRLRFVEVNTIFQVGQLPRLRRRPVRLVAFHLCNILTNHLGLVGKDTMDDLELVPDVLHLAEVFDLVSDVTRRLLSLNPLLLMVLSFFARQGLQVFWVLDALILGLLCLV